MRKSFGFVVLLLSGTSAFASGGTLPKDICESQTKIEASVLCSEPFTSNNSNLDEAFVLKTWGQKICKTLLDEPEASKLICRYQQLVITKKLDRAEALVIAGYTSDIYNYLSPENIAMPATNPSYKGFDIYNRVLTLAIQKLNQVPQYQTNETTYRGSNLYAPIRKSNKPIQFDRWTSTSCAKEIAFGPAVIEKSSAEKAAIEAKIRKDENLGPDEDIAGLQYYFYTRDPKSVPKQMTACQKIYFKENPNPPMTPESNFGKGNLKITILPPLKGKSKRVLLYPLSVRRSEAEILFPIGTKLDVLKVVGPNDVGGDGFNTFVTLREISN